MVLETVELSKRQEVAELKMFTFSLGGLEMSVSDPVLLSYHRFK